MPSFVLLIPNYLIVSKLGWLDSLWAIAIPSAGGAFGVFFLRQVLPSLPPGLSIVQGAYTIDYPVVMAGAVVASIPVIILFVLAQRHIIASVLHSGLKG